MVYQHEGKLMFNRVVYCYIIMMHYKLSDNPFYNSSK